jgi:centrin-1
LYKLGQIDARELKAIMKAFGVEAKKQDIRDLFADHGKDVKEGINFSEFTAMMSSRMGPRDSKE